MRLDGAGKASAPRRAVILVVIAIACIGRMAPAATTTLDNDVSPIRVVIDNNTARMTVTVKETGMVWTHPTTGGGHAVTVNSVTSTGDTHFNANVTINSFSLTLAVALDPFTGDLKTTIGGNPTQSIASGINYPYSFYPTDGSGYAVIPGDSGFVIPTNETGWASPTGPRSNRRQWFGGTTADRNHGESWVCVSDHVEDMLASWQNNGRISGGPQRVGATFQWQGSIGSEVGGQSGRLRYDRTATYRFFTSGGYVAAAKHFRQHAINKGWFKSLTDKMADDPEGKVEKLMGAPIIYLWGDGRTQTMLNALNSAGIDKALLQLSINHVNNNGQFPASFPAAVHTTNPNWMIGIYDIYTTYIRNQQFPPLNGFWYRWPTSWNDSQLTDLPWAYNRSGNRICHEMVAPFARDNRTPLHINNFGLDAYFFDVVCAEPAMECDDTSTEDNHWATRAEDIAARQATLNTAYDNPNLTRNLLVGAEQAQSWANPWQHWGEGVIWIGNARAARVISDDWLGNGEPRSAWQDSRYPRMTCWVRNPKAIPNDVLGHLLSPGHAAPLWDLVYHDTMLATTHWHHAHNKFVYAWDHADQQALIRGQAPLLHLVYNGANGLASDNDEGSIDERDESFWDVRWTNPNVSARVKQTYDTVCDWHGQVGMMELTDHQFLTSGESVQMSEFSADGGISGKGIVVNFGVYDGAQNPYGVVAESSGTNPWEGTIRGIELSVPVNEYRTYEWSDADTTPPGVVVDFTATPG